MKLRTLSSRPLSVSPLAKPTAAGYPTAKNHNFDFSEIHAWPIRSSVAAALLALGLGGCQHDANAEATDDRSRPQKVAPLTVATSACEPFRNVVVRTPMGGKAGPLALPEEVAIQAIQRGFIQAGVNLELEADYKVEDAILGTIDGFDSARKVGFLWAGSPEESGEVPPHVVEHMNQTGAHHIAVIYSDDQRFVWGGKRQTKQQAAGNLTTTVAAYVAHLRSIGAL